MGTPNRLGRLSGNEPQEECRAEGEAEEEAGACVQPGRQQRGTVCPKGTTTLAWPVHNRWQQGQHQAGVASSVGPWRCSCCSAPEFPPSVSQAVMEGSGGLKAGKGSNETGFYQVHCQHGQPGQVNWSGE